MTRRAGRLAGAVLGLLLATTGTLVVVGVVAARPLTMLLTPGFTGERLELTVTLVRIMFPGIGVLVLSAWCLGLLNSHHRFFLSYVAPVAWNAGILAALVGLGATAVVDPAIAAGVGVVVGGLAQTAIQIPRRPRGARRHVAPLVGHHLASRTTGPVGLRSDRGRPRRRAGRGPAGPRRGLVARRRCGRGPAVRAEPLPAADRAVRHERGGRGTAGPVTAGRTGSPGTSPSGSTPGSPRSAFFVVGTTAGYLLLGGALVDLLYGRGEFDALTVAQVALVLGAYSLALVPATASRLLQSALYAANDARTPAVVAVARVLLALAIGVPLMFGLDQLVVDLAEPAGFRTADPAGLGAIGPTDAGLRGAATNQHRLGAAGLAIGAIAGSWLEFGLLRRALRRRGLTVRLGGGTLSRLLAAGTLAAVVIGAAMRAVGDAGPLVTLAVPGTLGAAAYLGVAWWLRVADAEVLLQRVLRPRR